MKNENTFRRATLSTLQARTALSAIKNCTEPLTNEKDIKHAAKVVLFTLIQTFPTVYTIGIRKPLFAFILANIGKKAVKENCISIADYISFLAKQKYVNEKQLSDFGAFGDLFEILVRLALVKNANLINCNMLTVKYTDTCDIISKKYGKLEVGHNGKSFTFGTLFDYMDGDYNGIIYGVFSDMDKREVYNLCYHREIAKAIDYISNYACLWTDKYQFQYDMDNLTKGQGIAHKGENIQVVFNSGKYSAFLLAIENGKFKSLKETIGEVKK